MPEFLALMSSFVFGFGHVFARMGMRWSNPFSGAVISIFVSALLFWLGVLVFVPFSSFRTTAIFYFVIAGMFAPALGRFFNYMGIHRVGISRATPITAIAPLFSTTIAILFVGEKITIPIVLGTLLIILGAILLSHKKKEDLQWRKLDLIYPAFGALCFGISYNLRKLGLLHVPSPLIAAAMTTTSGFIFLLACSFPNRRGNTLQLKTQGLFYLVLSGFFSGIASLLSYFALNLGNIVVVSPLTNIFPLFGIALSAVFLRDVETINRWIITGALVTVVGVIFITLR